LPRPFFALRDAWRGGYGWSDLRADVLAGCVVGVVALPLSMALAIAVGVAPEHGLATAIVAGGLAALLGGSRVQVTGPTAAFVVVLAPVAARFGVRGLALASALAGGMLVAMALLRLGRLIRFVPYPVTTGFTAGIAVVIATLQVQGFLGLEVDALGAEAHWGERVVALARALPTTQPADALVGALTLGLLAAWRGLRSRIPAPLVALIAAAVAGVVLERAFGIDVATLSSRFGTPEHPSGVPGRPPTFLVPWLLPGPADAPGVLGLLRALLPAAFAIAMLGAIESLLSATVADGMSGTQHDPDAELLGQGVANLAAAFFGGFAATGAIARTATNVRSGARSPVAALVHAAFVLGAVLVLGRWLGLLPMSALAALLLMVAWNMSEVRHFVRVLRVAPRDDVAVLLVCFGATVLFDMTVAVTAGIVLASMLFMRRMIELSGARLIATRHPEHAEDLPSGVLVYDVGGPLFFGAAHKAMSQLHSLDRRKVRAVVLDLTDVPTVDATGVINLESALDRLASAGIATVLVGLCGQPLEALRRAGVVDGAQGARHVATVAEALALVREAG
jgi:SulP family sulfate permease